MKYFEILWCCIHSKVVSEIKSIFNFKNFKIIIIMTLKRISERAIAITRTLSIVSVEHACVIVVNQASGEFNGKKSRTAGHTVKQ